MSNPVREYGMNPEDGDPRELFKGRLETAQANLAQAEANREAAVEGSKDIWEMKVAEAKRKVEEAQAAIEDYEKANPKPTNESAQ